ncbi:MAG: YraN family protein [Butyrivibrio sp.]|nr:YraN family protein [Butyrivibrio sp.]
MNKRTIGGNTESLACEYLRSQGASVISSNYRCRQGEVDIIARDGVYLCFVEVKYRNNYRFGEPQEAVDLKKRRHICKVSEFYLYSKCKSFDIPVRYDVIAISRKNDVFTFKWIKNAFEYIE